MPVRFEADMDELIVHIGPPKTATTEIQQALMEMQDSLLAQGIQLNFPPGVAGHHFLADYLQGAQIDTETGLALNGWFLGDQLTNVYPDRAKSGRQLITAENLAMIPQSGAQELAAWSGADRIHVVAMLREPTRWLWSWWQQSCKTPGAESWADFVQHRLDDRCMFPSTLLNVWSEVPAPIRATLMEMDGTQAFGPVEEFLRVIGYVNNTNVSRRSNRGGHNQSIGAVEAILTRALVDEVAHELKYRSWIYFGDLPDGFISRSCMDLIDKARPMAELGRWVEQGEHDLCKQQLFNEESFPLIASYREQWLKDALATCANPMLTEEGRAALENCVIRYGQRDPFRGFNNACGNGFPSQSGGVELPGEIISLARTMAAAIGFRYQTAIGVAKGRL